MCAVCSTPRGHDDERAWARHDLAISEDERHLALADVEALVCVRMDMHRRAFARCGPTYHHSIRTASQVIPDQIGVALVVENEGGSANSLHRRSLTASWHTSESAA